MWEVFLKKSCEEWKNKDYCRVLIQKNGIVEQYKWEQVESVWIEIVKDGNILQYVFNLSALEKIPDADS